MKQIIWRSLEVIGKMAGILILVLILIGICQESLDMDKSREHFKTLKDDILIVAEAIEAYAEVNDGLYPNPIFQPLPDGRTITNFMPNGKLLPNRWDNEHLEPTVISDHSPGTINYRCYNNGTGFHLIGWDRPNANGMFGIDRHIFTRGNISKKT